MAVHADMHGYRHGDGLPFQREGASIGEDPASGAWIGVKLGFKGSVSSWRKWIHDGVCRRQLALMSAAFSLLWNFGVIWIQPAPFYLVAQQGQHLAILSDAMPLEDLKGIVMIFHAFNSLWITSRNSKKYSTIMLLKRRLLRPWLL
jgi:hypothetical protein